MDDQHKVTSAICRVCGLPISKAPSAKDSRCSCCGIQQGVEDQSAVSVKIWRDKWIRLGALWRDRSKEAQLERFAGRCGKDL